MDVLAQLAVLHALGECCGNCQKGLAARTAELERAAGGQTVIDHRIELDLCGNRKGDVVEIEFHWPPFPFRAEKMVIDELHRDADSWVVLAAASTITSWQVDDRSHRFPAPLESATFARNTLGCGIEIPRVAPGGLVRWTVLFRADCDRWFATIYGRAVPRRPPSALPPLRLKFPPALPPKAP